MLVDSHTHLLHTYSPDTVIGEISSFLHKFSYILDISTEESEFLTRQTIRWPGNVLSAYALYPEEAEKYSKDRVDRFARTVSQHPVCAIGECGLDYFHAYGTPELQKELFRAQIGLSISMELPLIIHSRNAFQDTYDILSEYRFNRSVIMHCFSYGPEEARKLLDLGCVLSYAGNITYNSSEILRESLKITPPDALLFETDAPYLSPVPHRGKKNSPEWVEFTYQAAAKLLEKEIGELEEQVLKNFKGIFRL